MKKLVLLGMIGSVMLAGGFVPPQMPTKPTKYPEGKLGEMVKLGEAIVNDTANHPVSKQYVGNKLACTNCHVDAGTTNKLGTFIGTATSFPAWSSREGTVQSLQDRVANCFMRSMDGWRPNNGTKLSMAIVSYITWLSSGLPINMNPKKPVTPYYTNIYPNKEAEALLKKATNANYKRGKELYTQKCAMCHMEDGQGVKGSFPPLWGKDSYNAGAGLAKLNKMATWMGYNMPKGAEGSLSVQEAVDLTIYVDSHDRPKFDLKDHLRKDSLYNSVVSEEKSDVVSNFKAFGLDLKKIKGIK